MRVKTEEKRRAIMEVARAVFRERGYAAATMAEISARLGGSKGTLYSYFTSKEELFSAVMLEMSTTLGLPELLAELEHIRDVRQAVGFFTGRLVRLLSSADVLDFRRMVIAEGTRTELGRLVYQNAAELFWGRFAQFYSSLVRRGICRDADPCVAAMHMYALCGAGAVQQLLEGAVERISEREIAATAEAAADVFVRAYVVKTAASRRPRAVPGRRAPGSPAPVPRR